MNKNERNELIREMQRHLGAHGVPIEASYGLIEMLVTALDTRDAQHREWLLTLAMLFENRAYQQPNLYGPGLALAADTMRNYCQMEEAEA